MPFLQIKKIAKRVAELSGKDYAGRAVNIAKRLGLSEEQFCRMTLTTKMFLSNVLGHAAELQYEKSLNSKRKKFVKAPTDVYYDYVVNKRRQQVKRFESASTDNKFIGVNLTSVDK